MMEIALNSIGRIVLIGAGKMGLALARGWVEARLPAGQLTLVDPQPNEATRAFAASAGIELRTGPPDEPPAVVVLAIKPQMMGEVLHRVRAIVGPHTLVLSIAAGISVKRIADALGTHRVVRTMPNTPAQIGKGISGAYAGSAVDDADRNAAGALLKAAGEVVWVESEADIDGITAVSGSGPAYVFHFVEALAAAAERQGFAAAQAMQLARQTVIGAAALMEADPTPVAELRQNVTSPKGTTEAGLGVLMASDGLTRLLEQTVTAARRRSRRSVLPISSGSTSVSARSSRRGRFPRPASQPTSC
jgi:pyrroline-5-carboxylate reductase